MAIHPTKVLNVFSTGFIVGSNRWISGYDVIRVLLLTV